MLKKEFEERTGFQPSDEQYKDIEELYMMTDLDKDKFCHLWTNEIEILTQYASTCSSLVYHKKQEIELAHFLIIQAQKYGSIELIEKAIEILGEKKYLTYKIENKIPLWEKDYELLKEILK